MTLVPLGAADGRDSWVIHAGDGRSFAVFVVDGGFRVTDARCPHADAALVDGRVHNGRLHCPWHWFRFDLETGRLPDGLPVRPRGLPGQPPTRRLVRRRRPGPPAREVARVAAPRVAPTGPLSVTLLGDPSR